MERGELFNEALNCLEKLLSDVENDYTKTELMRAITSIGYAWSNELNKEKNNEMLILKGGESGMIEKIKLQDMNRIIEINKLVAKLEDEVRTLKNEEYLLWKKNDFNFTFNNEE